MPCESRAETWTPDVALGCKERQQLRAQRLLRAQLRRIVEHEHDCALHGPLRGSQRSSLGGGGAAYRRQAKARGHGGRLLCARRRRLSPAELGARVSAQSSCVIRNAGTHNAVRAASARAQSLELSATFAAPAATARPAMASVYASSLRPSLRQHAAAFA